MKKKRRIISICFTDCQYEILKKISKQLDHSIGEIIRDKIDWLGLILLLKKKK